MAARKPPTKKAPAKRASKARSPKAKPPVQADDPDKPRKRKYRVYTSPQPLNTGRAITPFATPTARGSMSPWAVGNAHRR